MLRIVLDTNVVLDLFHWANVDAVPIMDALEAGQIECLADEQTLDELQRVLTYPQLKLTPEMIAGGQVPDQLITAFLARTPSTRVGQAEDIAGVVAMLLSNDGTWINGQVIHVNGGGLMPA